MESVGGELSRHYYIAVDRQEFKMGTFFDLLEHFWRRSAVPLVICCSSRDSLDSVSAAVSSRPHFHAKFLHSDLAEDERVNAIEEFRRAMSEWKKGIFLEDGVPPKLFLLIVTDACLPSNTLGDHSLLARAIVNYDFPMKKEAYIRRLTACLRPAATNVTKAASPESSANGIVLNIIVGAEVSTLRSIEEGWGVINEMPINVSTVIYIYIETCVCVRARNVFILILCIYVDN